MVPSAYNAYFLFPTPECISYMGRKRHNPVNELFIYVMLIHGAVMRRFNIVVTDISDWSFAGMILH